MRDKIVNYLRLIRFDRPIGTLLLLWPTLWALFIAAHGHPPVSLIIIFVIGVFLTRAAGCVINDFFDAEFDGQVARTMNRPLVLKTVTKWEAVLVAAVLILIAFSMAYLFLTKPTLLLSIPAVLILATYPLMKRFFAIPQLYFGVAFSFGILMAYMQITGSLNFICWLLFIANLFWCLGYDTIYAMVDMNDDLKIGIHTSAITLGDKVIPFVFGCYITFALLIALVAVLSKFSLIFWILWAISLLLLIYQVIVLTTSDRLKWFKMFLLNNRVGYIMLLAVILGLWF